MSSVVSVKISYLVRSLAITVILVFYFSIEKFFLNRKFIFTVNYHFSFSVDSPTNVSIQYRSHYGHFIEKQDYIIISCIADCNPVCSYQYCKNGKLLKEGSIGKLYLWPAQRNMSGRYSCSAKNSLMNFYQNSSNIVDINIKCRLQTLWMK